MFCHFMLYLFYEKNVNFLIELSYGKYDIIPINKNINNYINSFNKIDKTVQSNNNMIFKNYDI
mgnify:CR=1 FL=1